MIRRDSLKFIEHKQTKELGLERLVGLIRLTMSIEADIRFIIIYC